MTSKVYFFLWGMTKEMSLTRRSPGPLSSIGGTAAWPRDVPVVPFAIVLIESPASSILRLLEAGSKGIEVLISET